MSDRDETDVAEEMAKHHMALSALWQEWVRIRGKRKPQKPKEDLFSLRRKVERKVKSNGST